MLVVIEDEGAMKPLAQEMTDIVNATAKRVAMLWRIMVGILYADEYTDYSSTINNAEPFYCKLFCSLRNTAVQ